MRILLQYVKSQMKRNKRSTLSVMCAVFIASTLLCALCTWMYTQNRWMADIAVYEEGGWHAEVGGGLDRKDLELIEGYKGIQTVMVKGPFTSVRLSEDCELPYLILREADGPYWELMGEKNSILEGNVPRQPGEIVVSRSFFEQHPQYKLGDHLRLTAGNRMAQGKNINDGIRQEGESFVPSGEEEYILVGILDVATPTSIPGYYAMGYLERESLADNDEIVVYVEMQDIRDTYSVMDSLAGSLGLEKDETGNYTNHFRYHNALLSLNGVYPPDLAVSEKSYAQLLINVLMAMVVAGAFMLIIHSIFAMTTQSRIHQLGMLSSIGATPGQIRMTVLLEGAAASFPGILLGLVTGTLFAALISRIYTGILGDLVYFPVTVRTSWFVLAAAFLLSLGTALLSAFLPAKKAAKMAPVEAIRMQEGSGGASKQPGRSGHFPGRHSAGKKGFLGAIFGTEGWLARNTYVFYKRSFRAGIAAMVMCILLVSGFFAMLAVNNLITEKNAGGYYHNILMGFSLLAEPEPGMTDRILEAEGVEEGVFYYNTKVSMWVDSTRETGEFAANGGLAAVDPEQFSVLERDGRYRVRVYLFGLGKEDFAEYCGKIGEDVSSYYDVSRPKGILVSRVPENPDAFYREERMKEYPMLDWKTGERLELEEKLFDKDETDYRFEVEVGAVAQERPLLDAVPMDYSIQVYLPEEVYFSIVENFLPEAAERSYKLYGSVLASPKEEIRAAEKIREICREYLPESDYQVRSLAETARDDAVAGRAMEAVMNLIGLLLLLIGISSAVNGITTTLNQRRREFAMLRSVGMDNGMLCRLLLLEGVRIAVAPVLAALPLLFLACAYILGLRQLSWKEFLPVFPAGKVLLNLSAVMAAVAISYYLASRKIRRDAIVEAVREDLV